jgi:hypothetical protein
MPGTNQENFWPKLIPCAPVGTIASSGRCVNGLPVTLVVGQLPGSCPETGLEEIGRERQSGAPHVSQADFWTALLKSLPET